MVCGAQLWPGAVHWPDFKNPATLEWWTQQLQGVNDTLPIDGIWLDMNEARLRPPCTRVLGDGACHGLLATQQRRGSYAGRLASTHAC